MESDNNNNHNYITNDIYKECLRNHAASLGSYATDGCGEFTIDDSSAASSLTLHCAACGCHRNFHRKVVMTTTYSSAATDQLTEGDHQSQRLYGGKTKRFRTKFTTEQKEKMLGFAEKLGWKLQRKDEEDEVERFCRGLGISRQIFKVWMHNHKNSSSSSSSSPLSSSYSASAKNASSLTNQ